MHEEVTRWGYCRSCKKNVPHRRMGTCFPATHPLIDNLLERISTFIMNAHRLGDWSCVDCRKTSWYLSRERKKAEVFSPHQQVEMQQASRSLNLDLPEIDAKTVVETALEDLEEKAAVQVPENQWAEEQRTQDIELEGEGVSVAPSQTPDNPFDHPNKQIDLDLPEVKAKTILETTFEGKKVEPMRVDENETVESLLSKTRIEIPKTQTVPSDADQAEDEAECDARELLRFDQEYRDMVVDQLLFCGSTIQDLELEEEIGKEEIVAWIADRFRRMEGKVDNLESQLAEKITESSPDIPISRFIDTTAFVAMATKGLKRNS